MSWFIKTEKFTAATLNLPEKTRKGYISEHKKWVKQHTASGLKIFSGYLVDKNKSPGGGGLLIIESDSYKKAEIIIKKDPMILNKLVSWKLEELIPINKDSNKTLPIILDELSSIS